MVNEMVQYTILPQMMTLPHCPRTSHLALLVIEYSGLKSGLVQGLVFWQGECMSGCAGLLATSLQRKIS